MRRNLILDFFFLFEIGSGAYPPHPAREGGRWESGLQSPDDVSIAAAVEANDRFIEELERIRDVALGTVDS
jgi:hypothetical protein